MGTGTSGFPEVDTTAPHLTLGFGYTGNIYILNGDEKCSAAVMNVVFQCFGSCRSYAKLKSKNRIIEVIQVADVWSHWREEEDARYERQAMFAPKLMQALLEQGWKLLAAPKITRQYPCSMFFEKTSARVENFVCISAHMEGSLFVSGNGDLDLVDGFLAKTGATPEKMISNVRICRFADNPWSTHILYDYRSTALGRMLMLGLFEELENSGLRFYGAASLNVCGESIIFKESKRSGNEKSVCYFMFALKGSDRIRVYHKSMNQLRDFIDDLRPFEHRIQGETDISKDEHKCIELKLEGRPWTEQGLGAFKGREIIMDILNHLDRRGYSFVAALSIDHDIRGKDVFIFKEKTKDVAHTYCCIGLRESDKISLIGDMKFHALLDAIECFWPKGLSYVAERPIRAPNKDLTLCGYPWTSSSNKGILRAMNLVRGLVETMEKHGWKLNSAIDMSGRTKSIDSAWSFLSGTSNNDSTGSWFESDSSSSNQPIVSDADSLFFVRDV